MNKNAHRSPSLRRRGYLLVEIITVVALLGVFTVIIGATFSATYRGQADAVRRDERDHRVDAAISLLRRDIWNARTLTTNNDGLTLTDTAGTTTQWTWNAPWTRTVRPMDNAAENAIDKATSTTHFEGLPTENVGADVHGPSVTLHFGGKTSPAESITFVSQISLGGAP